ncbi:MAG: serine/threonine-protein kinase [Vicinamibacterales bacterium]
MIGTTIGPYRLDGHLGAGGMGVVYVAEDQRLGRKVALKFLPAEAVGDPEALERFRLEARSASALSHPGICAIHDIGVHEGTPYLVMELLRGETLRERIARGGLRISDVVDIGIQIADALEAAHAQGVVHRDIKPANIWVGDKLRVKILDFGLAKLARERPELSTGAADHPTIAMTDARHATRPRIENQLTAPGTAIGTVSYMSPEQARGEVVDPRTDIFSLGVVLYEMVTGRQAFGGSTSAVVFDAILNRAPVSPVLLNPDTPPRLVEAINTALEKDRELRYQTAASFEADLKRVRRDLQSGSTLSATQTAAVAAVSPSAVTTAVTAASPAAPTVATGAATAAAPAAGRGRWVAPLLAAAVLAAGATWYVAGGRGSEGAPTQAGETVARAQDRLEARDYRAARAEAAAALARDPGNREAARIQSAADGALARLDGILAAARESLEAGDLVAAARALASAQALAPADAQVAELAGRLASRPVAAAAPGPGPAPGERASRAAREPASAVARQPDPPPANPALESPPMVEPAANARAAVAGAPPPSPAATAPAPVPTPVPPPAPADARPVETFAPRAASPVERRAAVDPAPPRPVEPPPRESDEVLVRRVLDTYVRAIEAKDVALYRSVRPGLTADDERRLRESFAQVEKQDVDMRVEQLTITGDVADARVSRVDIVRAGGRTQTSRSAQTIRLTRRGGAWVIAESGR